MASTITSDVSERFALQWKSVIFTSCDIIGVLFVIICYQVQVVLPAKGAEEERVYKNQWKHKEVQRCTARGREIEIRRAERQQQKH